MKRCSDWAAVQSHTNECGELQLSQCSLNVFRWVAWLWRTAGFVLHLAAALKTPGQCFFFPPSFFPFHSRTRKDATMKIVLLIQLCLVSSPTSHNGPNSILPLFIKAPVVVAHCGALFAAKKTKIMLVGTLLKLLFASFFLSIHPFCLGYKKTKTDSFNECFRGMGQVLGEIVAIFWCPVIID